MMRCTAAILASVLFALPPTLAETGVIKTDVIDQRIERLMDKPSLVGLAVAVVEDGEIVFSKGYGRTHRGGTPVTTDTKFRWASVSKGAASSTAAILAAEGEVDLFAPIATYNTSLDLPGNGETKASLIDVLSHRVGLIPNAYDTRLEDGRDPADIRKALGKLKAFCAVGDCHGYQNVAYDAVTEVIEIATGSAFEDMVQKKLFDPLQMTTASYGQAALEASSDYARPHRRVRSGGVRQAKLEPYYYNVPAAAGINSSITDFAKFMIAQMGERPDVLPNIVLNVLHEPRVETLRERNRMKRVAQRMSSAEYGLGWRIYDYEGTTVIGHRGGANGYSAMMLFDPARDSGIVALWNSNVSAPVGLQFEVMDMILGLEPTDWLDIGNGEFVTDQANADVSGAGKG